MSAFSEGDWNDSGDAFGAAGSVTEGDSPGAGLSVLPSVPVLSAQTVRVRIHVTVRNSRIIFLLIWAPLSEQRG